MHTSVSHGGEANKDVQRLITTHETFRRNGGLFHLGLFASGPLSIIFFGGFFSQKVRVYKVLVGDWALVIRLEAYLVAA